MPILIKEQQRSDGKILFTYDTAMANLDEIANTIASNTDEPVQFIGLVNGKQSPIAPALVRKVLTEYGGQVAADVSFGGQTVRIQFPDKNQMRVISMDRMTADMLVGAGAYGQDDDDDDPFRSAGDAFPVPDPVQNRSADLVNRYADPEDEYYDEYDDDDDYYDDEPEETVKTFDWLFTTVMMMLPVVNIVFIIIWLLSAKTPQSKKNYLKVQIIYVAIGTLMAVLFTVMAASTGLLQAMLAGDVTLSPQATQEQTYGPNGYEDGTGDSTGEDLSDGGLADGSGTDGTSTDGSGTVGLTDGSGDSSAADGTAADGSATGDASGDGTTEGSTQPVGSDLYQNNNGTISVDSIVRSAGTDGRAIAVVTMTLSNTTDADHTAAELIDATGYQGQTALEPNYVAADGFNPDTFNAPIAAGASGTFQVSFFLVDSQTFEVMAASKETHEMILDAKQNI